ncbi:Pfam:DUF894 [Seminavis robusta]|uniref:Pfam:DUF894 n=1 Tax=Seminavis robusta TaxID=568900 RepID=A0A9N8DRA9_9STRA|nr:Pfam:DUF894 [Seminavis robusta]|eukprot:Sro295_g110500.1 Pfam:DUF894 (595) ;mRNA; r:56270-58054
MSTPTKTITYSAIDRSNSRGRNKKPRRRSSRLLVLRTKSLELVTKSLELATRGGYNNDKASNITPPPVTRRQSYKRVSSSTNDDSTESDQFQHYDEQPQESSTRVAVGICAYLQLLVRYPMYRAYFVSHVCQNLGDWFVRIASILVVEEFSSSGKTIANLSLSVLLPKAIFSQVGGVMADRFDRRVCMICLDLLSGVVVLGYPVAIYYKSLNLIYAVTILRSTLGATYYPLTMGMVPLLIPHPHDLQLAVNLNGFAWSACSIVGGLVAGGLMSRIGFQTCYYIDCVTFFVSAAWMYWGVSGNFTVHNKGKESSASPTSLDLDDDNDASCPDKSANLLAAMVQTFTTVTRYLSVCGFGLLVFQKCSASLVWGIEDVVGAEFSTVFREDGSEDEALSSWHMGLLFSVVGAGCMVGPALVNLITDARYPHTLQRACWIGYCFLTLGWLLISTTPSFPMFLVFSFIRVIGSGIAWINSTLLLQTLCEPSVLGRVLAVEYTLMTLLEASSSMMSGWLEYAAFFSKSDLALFGAGLGILVIIFWGVYYFLVQGGAASPRFASMDVYAQGRGDSDATGAHKAIEVSCIEKAMHEAELPESA